MAQNARGHGFMIFPLAVILLNNRMKELFIIRRPYIGNSFGWSLNCHFLFSFFVCLFLYIFGFKENIGIVSRSRDHFRSRIEANSVKEAWHSDALY